MNLRTYLSQMGKLIKYFYEFLFGAIDRKISY